MKKIILLICFFFVENSIKAQDVTSIVTGTTFNYQMISNTQHNFTFHTYFNLGYQSTCPSLINPTFSIVDNTLYVKGYYDVTGAWPTAFCNSFDTVTYNYQIPSNITHIITSTNVISPNNTPPYIPSIVTYENVYTRDFDLSLLSTSNLTTKNISVYPNPTNGNINISNDIDFHKISINNSLGQIISTINKNQSGVYNLQDIQNGLYYITFYNTDNEKIGVSKLIKQN
jgi:hypothetical protein